MRYCTVKVTATSKHVMWYFLERNHLANWSCLLWSWHFCFPLSNFLSGESQKVLATDGMSYYLRSSPSACNHCVFLQLKR